MVPGPPAPGSSSREFTVAIPVHNGKALLRNCLRSVVDSTFPRRRFEIVVADDGSTDPETLAILAEFERELAGDAGFFRVIRSATNSGGAARPRNTILDHATGEYVFFVDADDTIGRQSLDRIAGALALTPADWVAVHQVAVNGRATVFRTREAQQPVPRANALKTLTVHKVFRRAEIERQRLRFDEGLPSGQDLAFAFHFILNADSFLMLGGYDFYFLTQHADDTAEPPHLSKSATTPKPRIVKNERILRSMLASLNSCDLPIPERRQILARITLPRVLIAQNHLKAIISVGPAEGTRALRRLAELLSDPLVAELSSADLEAAAAKGLTTEHLVLIAASDWAGLATLVSPGHRQPKSRPRSRWAIRGRRLVNFATGRARHRQLVHELFLLRRSVDLLREQQRAATAGQDSSSPAPADTERD